jgi:hypothetical protein
MGSEETAWTTTCVLGVASFSQLMGHESVAALKDCNIVSCLAAQNCGQSLCVIRRKRPHEYG